MTWEPQPGPQSSAITAQFIDELFFGGARGGGKSDYLLGDFMQDISRGNFCRGIIFRKTYNELEELQVRARELFPAIGGEYKTHASANNPFSNSWYFPGGATLKMRYLEHERDADGYQGHQYSWIGFDELTNHATPYGYDKLKACLRSASGLHGRIRASGNPGGKGHIWVKARFIDVAPAYHPFTDKDTGLSRVFIPSKVTDNKYLADNKQYISLIKSSGSKELVKAWLEGDWDVVAGAFFDCWDKSRHVIKPFSIPSDWTKFRSFDWGSARPFSVGWWAIADGNNHIPKNALVRYREWYGASAPNVGLKLTAEQVGEGIVKRDGSEKMAYSVADPSCWKVDGGASVAERMAKVGARFKSADNSRINGWDQMRQRLIGIDGEPMLYVFETCLDFIRTVPLLQHDTHKPEDIDTEMEDHCFAAGTLVMTDKGYVEIESLPESGLVLSENGCFEKYRSARLVKKQVNIIELEFSNGVSIKCTPDHKFMLNTDEMEYAFNLVNKELKCIQLSSKQQYKNILALGIIYAESIFKKTVSGCIELYGRLTMEKYQTDTMFITLTEIGLITQLKILSVLVKMNILEQGMEKIQEIEGKIPSKQRRLQHQNGTEATKGKPGIKSITKKIAKTFCMLKQLLIVNIVDAALLFLKDQCFVQTNVSQHGVGTQGLIMKKGFAMFAQELMSLIAIAKHDHVQELAEARKAQKKELVCLSKKEAGVADVYCITVPSTGLFVIEGGLLVSNCADDARYGVMSRPFSRPIPAKKTNAAEGTIAWVYERTKEVKEKSPYRL